MEKLNQEKAMEMLFRASNSVAVKKPRINPAHVQELAKDIEKWKEAKVVTTPDGLILEGIDYVAAVAKTGKEAVIDLDSSGTPRRARRGSRQVPALSAVHEAVKFEAAANKLAIDVDRLMDKVAELVADKIITTKVGNS